MTFDNEGMRRMCVRDGPLGGRSRWRTSMTPVRTQCATCWGQTCIYEPGPLGLLPVFCEDCAGTGFAWS
jgi:hypothetical protein